MERFTAVWLYDSSAGAYLNHTIAAEIGSTPFAFIDTGDYCYFGFSRRFEMLVFTMSTVASYGTLIWEYSNGADSPAQWTRVVPMVDSALSSATDNYVYIRPPDDWQSVSFTATNPHAATPPDLKTRYWLRVSSATITTVGSVSSIECVPYARYTTPERVAACLQIPSFTDTTVPSYKEVEDRIHEIEGKIDYRTKKSWKYRVVNDEYHEFSLSGMKLWRKDVRSILYLQIWNGAGWDVKTQARTGDYFYVPMEGMVYFSRYFLLPARLAFVGPHWWGWGVGEFTKAVKISYIYGRDIDNDDQGSMIQKLAEHMTACELYRSHDYSILAVSGSDKVPLETKIQQWTVETEDDLESLRMWEIV